MHQRLSPPNPAVNIFVALAAVLALAVSTVAIVVAGFGDEGGGAADASADAAAEPVTVTLSEFVFTGGVGENAPAVRAAVAARLDWAGVHVDPTANDAAPDARISPAGAPVEVFVVAAREDLEIARAVRALTG